MSAGAWLRWVFISSTIIGGGVLMMRATVPTEEEFYNKLSPELKREMDKIIRQREGSQTMKERLNEAGEKDQIVWGDQLSNRPNTSSDFGTSGFGGTRRF
ncbi:hypothetical protein I204_06084 [Kwoniella mangroviensis CBS 8886]|uniref:uncharacterized protein n=1 Tax=Kwoniella mangroviensis CBS 8507 TaxID=1296122 RepID=UPI00080D2478|nr:uncharacterized protein I203_03306 [Kwoniella mangroviensis CBS 8507]OCF67609.1 hypothetical protein I203_03306 [Kwoniella mangroviensis CBS 8507]OCF72855.1 hypothetical protein I204_06084 [Kwoniella mangroviensis CBS 8886]